MESNKQIIECLLQKKDLIEHQIQDIDFINSRIRNSFRDCGIQKKELERNLQSVCMSIWIVARVIAEDGKFDNMFISEISGDMNNSGLQ